MRLYNRQQSGNSYKVRLLVSQLGLACEIVDVEPLGGTRTPAFLELNPAGQAPVLELDDGRLLPESNAILWYLAEGTALLPEAAFERAGWPAAPSSPATATASPTSRSTATRTVRRRADSHWRTIPPSPPGAGGSPSSRGTLQ